MSATNPKTENLKADVVIVGAGAAGLSAAVAVRESGVKDVIVLESRKVPGGNSAVAGGIMGVETTLQELQSIHIGRDEIFKSVMDYTHWKADAKLIRSMVDISGDNVRWLEEMGVKFERLVPHYMNQVYHTYHATRGPERSGFAIIQALVKRCEELGVRILCETPARKLLAEKNGTVNGVLAEANGKGLRIDAVSIIISTGGFAGNKELLKKLLPGYEEDVIHIEGIPHNGDGILMAEAVGAAIGGQITPEAEGPNYIGSGHVDFMAQLPYVIWVTKHGERFIQEDMTSINEIANAMHWQTGKITYALFDEGIKNMVLKEDFNLFSLHGMDNPTLHAGLEGALKLQAEEGKIKVASSLKEIAAWIGADPQVLENTVNQYNDSCERNHDALLVKDRRFLKPLSTPPYYAVPCQIALLVTHGGIMIDHHLAVLDDDGNIIQGLYSAGDDTSGRMGDTYNIRISGLSFCFAVGSGRIAGANAAKHVMGK
ncbi:FAD-dependent oxidoreductase [Chloroflexota bacterium]